MAEQELKIKDASRKKVKVKIGVNGPSGSGKTMGALLIAHGICGDWTKIGVVDTENESASLYEDLCIKFPGAVEGRFKTIDLAAPFSPERYITCISMLENAGMEVIIIDSGTHEWSGIGGYNDITDILARSSYKGNNWAARSVTMPRHRKFIDYILQSRCHVIVCNRSKVETIMGDDKKVKKIGMKEVQDGEFEYEMSIVFTIDRDTHTATATKDRTNVFEGKEPFVIASNTGKEIKQWCELGIELTKEKPIGLSPIGEKAFGQAIEKFKAGDKEVFGKVRTAFALTDEQSNILNTFEDGTAK